MLEWVWARVVVGAWGLILILGADGAGASREKVVASRVGVGVIGVLVEARVLELVAEVAMEMGVAGAKGLGATRFSVGA